MAKNIVVVNCATCPNVRPDERATSAHAHIKCSALKNRHIGRTLDFILRTPEWCPLQDITLTYSDRDVDAAQCIWGHMMECYALVAPNGDCGFPDISPHQQFMYDLLTDCAQDMREACRDKEMLRNLWAVHTSIEAFGIKTHFEDDFIPWFWEHCLVWETEPVERFMSFRTNWEEQSLHKLKREG